MNENLKFGCEEISGEMDQTYATALHLMKSGKPEHLECAISLWESILGWRDSEKQYEEAKVNFELAQQRARKRKTIRTIIVCAVSLLFAIACTCYFAFK